MKPVDRLIVALDNADRKVLCSLAAKLRGHVGMVKIGLEAFVAHGGDLVREVRDLGVDVFLDLKMHDIPHTVAAAARQAASLGVRLLTLHAQGGAAMIRAARAEVGSPTQIIAVTVLTSLDQVELRSLGATLSVPKLAYTLAEVAMNAGADGLVCSAHELEALRELSGTRVVPGIRPSGSAAGDQRRVATPGQAIRQGATWIVVGRPILEALDPVAAAQSVVAEIAAAESNRD